MTIMLTGHSTKYGAGITLWGDYRDLDHLRDTIYHLADDDALGGQLTHYVLGLAYDVRHAAQGDRLEETFGFDELDSVTYRGVQILWPYFLTQVSLLRRAAAHKVTTKAHQADLMRLESVAEEALVAYDAEVGRQCLERLPLLGQLPADYLVEFSTEVTREYVCEGPAGKQRFRKLPDVLSRLSSLSPEYREFRQKLKDIAKEQGCRPEELSNKVEWPSFKW